MKVTTEAAANLKGNIVQGQMTITYVPIGSVRPNSYNPNRMADHEFDLLKRSILTNGFTRPVVVRKATGEIVDGYHRWLACSELGHTEIGVYLVDMTEAQAKIATLRLNRAHGEEDAGLAADVFRELQEMGAIEFVAEELQLDDVEMARLLGDMPTDELRNLGGLEAPPEMLGATGTGLSAQDVALGVNTDADARRAREELLKREKAMEERRMSAEDESAYRLVLIYDGEEAALVRRVLASLGSDVSLPAAVVRLCREELARAGTG